MTVSNLGTNSISLDLDITRIILNIHRHNPMAPGRYTSGQNQSRGPHFTASTTSESPRRRSVAIHDLLNPVGGTDGGGVRQPSWHNDYYSSNDQERRWSRQSSLDLASNASPQSGSPPSSSGGRPSPPRGRERREFRPTYSEEEVNFIWYHREDLGWEWKEVLHAFNRQFPGREVGGIQCKFYRHLENNGVPQVRRRDRTTSAAARYGMRANTGLRYSWMR
ncbi:MAG: hypothetical protein Q9170_000919 [Blastenia crenularia]